MLGPGALVTGNTPDSSEGSLGSQEDPSPSDPRPGHRLTAKERNGFDGPSQRCSGEVDRSPWRIEFREVRTPGRAGMKRAAMVRSRRKPRERWVPGGARGLLRLDRRSALDFPAPDARRRWGHSSAGRALALQARGHRFDPGWLHLGGRCAVRFPLVDDAFPHRRNPPRDALGRPLVRRRILGPLASPAAMRATPIDERRKAPGCRLPQVEGRRRLQPDHGLQH